MQSPEAIKQILHSIGTVKEILISSKNVFFLKQAVKPELTTTCQQ
jgi:hypothetical protein